MSAPQETRDVEASQEPHADGGPPRTPASADVLDTSADDESVDGNSHEWCSLSPDVDYSSGNSSSAAPNSADDDDDCVIIKAIINNGKEMSPAQQDTDTDTAVAMATSLPEDDVTLLKRPLLSLKKVLVDEDTLKDTPLSKRHKLQPVCDISPCKDEEQHRRYSRRLRKMKQRDDGHPPQADAAYSAAKKVKSCCNTSGSSSVSSSSSGGSVPAPPDSPGPGPQPRVNTRSATRRMWTVGCVYRAPSPEHLLERRLWPAEGMHERPLWPDPRYELPDNTRHLHDLRKALHESFHYAAAYCVQIARQRKGLDASEDGDLRKECDSPRCPVRLLLTGFDVDKLEQSPAAAAETAPPPEGGVDDGDVTKTAEEGGVGPSAEGAVCGGRKGVDVHEEIIALSPTLGVSERSGRGDLPNVDSLVELLYYTSLLYCTICSVSPAAVGHYLEASAPSSFTDYVNSLMYSP